MKMLKSVAEQKFFDNQFTSTPGSNAINNIGVIGLISNVTQGASKNQRIGDRICLSSLEISFNAYWPGLDQADTAAILWTWRFIIFVWKDDTTPTLGDILENGNFPTTSPFNHDAKVKRKILYDKVFNQNMLILPDVAAAFQNGSFSRKIIIPSKVWRKYSNIYFQSATNTAVNHLYFLAVSEESDNDRTWNVDWYTRITFVDL